MIFYTGFGSGILGLLLDSWMIAAGLYSAGMTVLAVRQSWRDRRAAR